MVLVICITVMPVWTGEGNDKLSRTMQTIRREVAGFDTVDSRADQARHRRITENHKQEEMSNTGIGLLIARISLYLALLVALIFLIGWIARRSGMAGGSRPGGGAMDVVELLPLGQNRQVVLVRVLDKIHVLAQTPNTVQHLDTLAGDQALEVLSSAKGAVSLSRFKDVFGTFMQKMKR